jgi:GT2 family glycosyltransferase
MPAPASRSRDDDSPDRRPRRQVEPAAGATNADVSAVILSHDRPRTLEVLLDRLAAAGIDEVIVVDSSSTDGPAEIACTRPGVRVIQPGDLGTAGRNVGAREARGGYLLMLDDDAYPLPDATEKMSAVFERDPELGLLAGLVHDVDEAGRIVAGAEPGSFDWFLRAGRGGPVPADGLPTFFFPEGACMIRRDAFLQAGGFYAPYFLTMSELDLATRMLASGWDVRYLPTAEFHHIKAPGGLRAPSRTLRYRVRNQIWYFWLRFPPSVAARRVPAYLAFDLVECGYRGALGSWLGGIADAWRLRGRIRGDRDPVPRGLLGRVEMNRGRLHLRLLTAQLRKRLARRPEA